MHIALHKITVSPTMNIYHCLHDGGSISVRNETRVDAIRDTILTIDEDKGNCPKYQPWRT